MGRSHLASQAFKYSGTEVEIPDPNLTGHWHRHKIVPQHCLQMLCCLTALIRLSSIKQDFRAESFLIVWPRSHEFKLLANQPRSVLK